MKTFKGKNALWFILIFMIYNCLPFIILLKGTNMESQWFLIVLLVVYYSGDLIFLPIMINNKIELYDDYFVFYYGFSKDQIYIKDIIDIKKSHNFIASSANSLDRLYIHTCHKDMYIALQNNDKFMKIIKDKLDINKRGWK